METTLANPLTIEPRQGGQTERRQRSRRFPVTAPARFSWQGADGAWHQGKGKTRDISIHGVFVWAWPVPMPGTRIEITVEVPALVRRGTALRLNGSGVVLRIDPRDSQANGFAAEVNFQTDRVRDISNSDSETGNQ
jgi:hypothetical protein